MSAPTWLDPIRPQMDAVEDRIARVIRAAPFQHDALTYITASHGKRMRPAFVVLCSRLGNPEEKQVTDAAAAVEFLHVATLVHDDVIDASPTRRGQPSLAAAHGDGIAVVVGDYYLNAGLRLINDVGNPLLVASATAAMIEICTGELMHVAVDSDDAEATYYAKSEAKTAALLRISAMAGAVAGRVNPEHIQALDEHARCLGVAFQIIDDILDYTADVAVLGKPAGADFSDGTITLPLLFALRGGGDAADELRAAVRSPREEKTVERVVTLVRESAAMDDVRRVAEQYTNRAKSALDAFDDSPAKESLIGFCESVIGRTS